MIMIHCFMSILVTNCVEDVFEKTYANTSFKHYLKSEWLRYSNTRTCLDTQLLSN